MAAVYCICDVIDYWYVVVVVTVLFIMLIVYKCRCAVCSRLVSHSGETEPLLPRAEPTYTGL